MTKKPPEYLIRLAKELKKIWDDREWVVGTINCVIEEEDCMSLLDFIENYDNVNVETITVFSNILCTKRAELNSKKS